MRGSKKMQRAQILGRGQHQNASMKGLGLSCSGEGKKE